MADLPGADHGAATSLMFHDQAVLFIGPLGGVDAHVHAAPAVLAGLDGPVRVWGGGSSAEARALWVPPGWSHAVDGFGGRVAVLYLEPGGAWARRARQRWPATHPQALSDEPDWLDAMLACQQQPGPATLAARLNGLFPAHIDTATDDRVAQALQQLRQADEATPGAPAALARATALSGSRLRHLFTTESGVAMRRYRVWRRLISASREALAGQSLTQAAAAAGFCDQAHFTRSFRAMFGLPPSAVLTRPGLRWFDGAGGPG